MNTVHYSCKSDEWGTPHEIFDPLELEFGFDLDPCASEKNYKVDPFFTKRENALRIAWYASGYRSAFVNPPYSKLKEWISKCDFESKQGMLCVMLIPSRTDTKAWHTYIYDSSLWRFCPGVEVRFIPGRIVFLVDGKRAINPTTGKPQSAPFPYCIVIFRPV